MQYWPNTSCYFLPIWSVIFQKLVIIMSLVWAKIELNSEMKCFCIDPSFFPTLLARMLTCPEEVMFVIQSVACCSSPMRFFHLSPTVSLRSFPTRGRGPGPAPPLPLAPSLRVTLTSRYPWQAARTRWLAAVVGQWEKTFAWCPCSGPLFLWINLAHFYSCHFPLTLTVTQENNIHPSSV